MKLTFVTLFPEICRQTMMTGVLGKAVENGLLEVETVNLRDFSKNNYGSVDDTPYGGGPGMLIKVEPVVEAVESIDPHHTAHRILLSPRGTPFKQTKAKEFSRKEHLLFICGRYEGFDERVKMCLSPEVISMGDYVLTGGELPALSIADASCRLIDGVLGSNQSAEEESFSCNSSALEYPHYTRPREYRNFAVPDVLLNGDHQKISQWRLDQSDALTQEKRPDLLCASLD